MFLNENQLKEFGFKKFGENIKISDKASIYNAENISIGNNVRIDDFCILSAGEGGIEIGSSVVRVKQVELVGIGRGGWALNPLESIRQGY